MMRSVFAFTLLFLIAAPCGAAQQSANAAVQEKTCTDSGADQALDWALHKSDGVHTWSELYRVFKKFGQCDDGAVGEAYSDTTAQLFINDWKGFPTMERLTTLDRSFKEFVLRHIDETLDNNEVRSISQNARLHCPSGGQQFCKMVEDRAKITLSKLKQDEK
jgi:hypothetical protein